MPHRGADVLPWLSILAMVLSYLQCNMSSTNNDDYTSSDESRAGGVGMHCHPVHIYMDGLSGK